MTFCSFLMLCIPLGTTFELLPAFPLFYLCTRWCMLRFYILHPFGDLALVELNKKGKITSYGPIKNLSPLWKGKGCHRKMKKDDIKLHVISLKLIRIPRSGYVVAVHILQSVRTGPRRRYHQKRSFPFQLQLAYCVRIGHSLKHQMPWLNIFQPNLSVTSFYCFGLIFIDALHSLNSGPLYSIFCYVIINFVFC
jgi:hypothetical protein